MPGLPARQSLIAQVEAIDREFTKTITPFNFGYGQDLLEFSRSERLFAIKRYKTASTASSIISNGIDRARDALDFVRTERLKYDEERYDICCAPSSRMAAASSLKSRRGSYESDLFSSPSHREFQETTVRSEEPEDTLPPVLVSEFEEYCITHATSPKSKFEDLFFWPVISSLVDADSDPFANRKDVREKQSCGLDWFCLYADAIFFESYAKSLVKCRKVQRNGDRHFNRHHKVYKPATKPLYTIPFEPVDPSPMCIGVALTDILEMQDIYMEDAHAAVFKDIPLSSNWINLIVQFYDDEPTEVMIVVWCECSEITRAKLAMEVATTVYDYFETSSDGPGQIDDLRLVALGNVDPGLENWIAQYAVVQATD